MEVEKDLTVANKAGMHLRAASKIVNAIHGLDCEVDLVFDGRVANAKSIMSLTQLMAQKGNVIHLRAKGSDAKRAALALDRLFRSKFGEE